MRNRTARYAFSFAALAAAVGLRLVLDPLLGDSMPLVTLFGAVAAAVWIGGHRPAILVALFGYLACHYLFIPPRGQVALNDVGTVVGLIAYLFTCSLIIGFGEAMRSAQARASEQRREVLQVTLEQHRRRGHHDRQRRRASPTSIPWRNP